MKRKSCFYQGNSLFLYLLQGCLNSEIPTTIKIGFSKEENNQIS